MSELLTIPPHAGFNFTKTLQKDTYPLISPLTPSGSHKSHPISITGASKGLGRRLALSFAQSRALALDAFGDAGLDISVNNAGWAESVRVMGEVEVEVRDWWHTWEVDAMGLFASTSMEKTIVNMSSMGAHLMGPGVTSAYQTSKLAVLRLTELMNVDHGPQDLLAYSIHPGGVLTDIVLRMPPEVQRALTDTPALSADSIAFLTREERMAGWAFECAIGTWDMEELFSRKDEFVSGDKLKVRMVL
ncbi:NAD-P-binding protein [Stereum hirsutum FP-91666 SS1]|uniref:NAD-P-binding protein n=1 Tax=Stereum hirsutum (strain FP-91666) TaxID=721885 RepID=UPI0004449486|nr:NAD-P-binding protein [Stereum hirsutum FP-91666 SS1]EIM81303.1 NAD-P-binding protein [Stereum hirsutum FP-91666 SS1]